MKYFLLLSCLVLCGCDSVDQVPAVRQRDPVNIYEGWNISSNLNTIEYSGCEYVTSQVHNGYSITHKGNCKFCAERNK
jgi:hypothetical protein